MRIFPLLTLLVLPCSLFAQADAKVPDPDPEAERKSFIVADGFEVNLYAADPILAKPIQMNFDPQGRLWVACSETYPQIKPGQQANDKILILEDTHGTGKVDKTTVFADGLLIPTGVEPGDGGAYVANSTELLHFSRPDKNGKATQKRIILSGFGTEDTHHILHTLRWGPDGMLYMNQSIYIHSHIETPLGVRTLNAGGIWRFRPETLDLEILVRGFVNPWGHQVDRWGQSFITDGAYGEGINHGVPGAYYYTAVGSDKILHGLNPGSPKHCGLEIVGGSHLPDSWQDNMITNDFRGHRVCRFALKEDGSTYASRELPELIKTAHPAFRPIDVKMGPDGAIYIADWYNPIIQHGEVDFRDPRRDHTHGRIWRVTAKGWPLVKVPDLVHASPEGLLNYLKSPEDWTRQNAKRVLKERGEKEVLPTLAGWWKKLDPANPGYEHQLLEALWTYQSLNVVEPELLKTLLRARDYRVRAAATRVLSQWQARLPDAQELFAAQVHDEHPRVRMEAVRGVAELQTARGMEIALEALDRPLDQVLEYCLWLTARDLEPIWMPAFREGKLDFGGNVRHLTFALQSVNSSSAVQPLLQLLKSGKVAKERQDAIWVMVTQLGSPKELDDVMSRVLDAKLPVASREVLLTALEDTARQRKVAPSKGPERIAELFTSTEDSARRSAYHLAGLWKREEQRPALEKAALDEKSSLGDRQAAFQGLQSLGGAKSKQILEKFAGEPYRVDTRRMAVIMLAGLDLEAGAKQATVLLSVAKPEEEVASVYQSLLQRKGGAASLASALKGKKLPADVAKVGIRTLRSSLQDAPELLTALTQAGGCAALKEPRPDEIKSLVKDVAGNGDPIRGEMIFRRTEMLCLKCHSIGGAGGQVGPDLTSIGASAQVDYLVESILLPNKAIKEGYHALRIGTDDGRVFDGIKVRETKTEIVLRDPEDKEVIIPIGDITSKKESRSLMPDGLADPLTRQELVDLVRFLSELGKLGPYAPSKARMVRRWQVLEPAKTTMEVLRRQRVAAVAENQPGLSWATAYSKVSGELPLESIPKLVVWEASEPVAAARCFLDVTTPGKVKLRVSNPKALSLFVGSTPIDLKEETILDLKQGPQTLLLILDVAKRKDPIRIDLEDLPDSAARVSVINGK